VTSRRPWTRWPGGCPRAACRSPSLPGAGHPARRGPGSGRPERGGSGQGSGRTGGSAFPEPDAGAGSGLLRTASDSRLYAYVVLSVTTGLRTEELRALRWTEVDLDAGTVAVYRAVRASADTKTPGSRRVLSLPRLAVQALREHLDRQAEERLLAGALWQDHGLVFASVVGTPLDRHNVRREFRKITPAGLGTDWVPREMRHTFVSLLSSNGIAVEDIADLVGHRARPRPRRSTGK
jgi:integrase